MYEPGRGCAIGCVTTVTGGATLPNTGGNVLLTIVSLTAILVGSAILISTLVRFVAKRAYKA